MRSFGVGAVLLMAALTLGSCTGKPADVNWQNPNVAKDEWSLDIGDCRREARAELARKVGPAATMPPPDNIGGGTDAYNRQMSNYELSRFEDRAFKDCMRRKGYTPISGK